MRKTILFLVLGAFLGTATSTFACDHDKACATSAKGSKAAKSCTMAKGAKATKECTSKDAKACKAKTGMDCSKEMKASKDMKACCVKKDLKKS